MMKYNVDSDCIYKH